MTPLPSPLTGAEGASEEGHGGEVEGMGGGWNRWLGRTQPLTPTPPSPCAECQLMYTMTTKNTVMRAMTLLAGAMGPKEVLRHFQDKFIPESNSLLKKGYSLGAGQDHLCNHAAWMQSPLEADAPAERLADLSGAPQDSPRSSGAGRTPRR